MQSLSNVMDASMEDLARCPGIGERKVKRLYDTFHEPFKRVIARHPTIPVTPVQKDAETSSQNEVAEVEKEDNSPRKRTKKEPELTVKSALSAAFANYADKFGKKDNELQGQKTSETSAAAESETGKDN